jgi:hypothetical protein
MTTHLLKLCVGVDSVEHLAELQAKRLEQARRRGLPPLLRHFTRHAPRLAREIAGGGSLYWVIRGFVRVRQRILAFEQGVNPEGARACAIVLDPGHVRTELRPVRAFQGWRYLSPENAPPDAGGKTDAARHMPEALAAELKALGLL